MTNINVGRVLLGGLVAGVVLNIGEALLNGLVLAQSMKADFDRLHQAGSPMDIWQRALEECCCPEWRRDFKCYRLPDRWPRLDAYEHRSTGEIRWFFKAGEFRPFVVITAGVIDRISKKLNRKS